MNRVSFLIPCYNSVGFIVETYEKLSKQSYTNVEFIFIDDGSEDDTLCLLKKIEKQDKRVIVRSKENGGIESALKYGIEFISGDYVFLMGHDDWPSPDLAEKCIAKFQKSKDIDAVKPYMAAIDDHGRYLFEYRDQEVLNGIEALSKTITKWEIHTFLMWKTSIFKKISEISTEGIMNFDEIATRYLLTYCRKIECCDAYYFYYQHPNSVTKKITAKLLHPLLSNIFLKNILIKKGLYDKFSIQYEQFLLKELFSKLPLYFQLKKNKQLEERSKTILKRTFTSIDKAKIINMEVGLEKLKLKLLLSNFTNFMLYYKFKTLIM